jgi:ABC-type multidrug transport system ATPase subunit
MRDEVSIHLTRAGKRYNRDWIFRNLSLEIPSGSRTALIGPNGSGKSTLLGVLSSFLSLSEGDIQWKKNGVRQDKEKIFEQIAICAPYLDLPEMYSALELFEFHFGLKRKFGTTTFQELLESAGLGKVGNKLIRDYSSGMKQRIKLLLAFYSDVPVLLLDEPTSNLDASGINWYNSLLEELPPHRTLIVASNLSYEYEICNQYLILSDFKN